MNSYAVSVIIATFNPIWDDLKATLISIVKQIDVHFEIIIADDGSKNNIKREVDTFFDILEFSDYKYIYSNVNRGTVINFLSAVEKCDGKYIKIIGQDDLLHSRDTLKHLYLYAMKNQLVGIAGNIQCFKKVEQEIYLVSHRAQPQNIKMFRDKEEIKLQTIICEDYINGASVFYERNVFEKYLKLIEHKILLCEDMIFRLMVLDECELGFYDKPVIYYRVGTGISSGGQTNPVLKYDLLSYEKMVYEKVNNHRFRRVIKARLKMLEKDNKFNTFCWLFSNNKVFYTWLRNKYSPAMTDSVVYNNYLFECIAEGSAI